jgi:hypothetical protein
MKFKHIFVLLTLVVALIFCQGVGATVIFQQNFDSLNNWTLTQLLYPGDASPNCFSGCGLPGGFTAIYNGRSYCAGGTVLDYPANSGGPGNNTLGINTGIWGSVAGSVAGQTCYGGSGKCLTYWDEVCEYSTGDAEDSDNTMAIDLGGYYPDLYVKFRVKFPTTFSWDSSTDLSYQPFKKMWHIQYWDGKSSPFLYHTSNGTIGATDPFTIGGLKYYSYADSFQLYAIVTCANGNNDYCSGTPAWKSDEGGSYPADNTLLGNLKGTGQDSPNMYSPAGSRVLFDGNWHEFVIHVKLNTISPSKLADGAYDVWIDGVQVYTAANHSNRYSGNDGGSSDHRIPWVQNGGHATSGFRLVSFGGNNANRFKAQGKCTGTGCEQWWAIDDIVIATTYNEASAGGKVGILPPKDLQTK